MNAYTSVYTPTGLLIHLSMHISAYVRLNCDRVHWNFTISRPFKNKSDIQICLNQLEPCEILKMVHLRDDSCDAFWGIG